MTTTEATAERIAKATAIDPIVAVAIIAALVQLITLCMESPTPEEVAEAAKNPTILQWAVMRNAVFREMRANMIQRRNRRGVWHVVRAEMRALTPEAARAMVLDNQATADWGD